MTDLLPEVLLNALRQYKFDGSPLWGMADRRDHIKIEEAFGKTTHQHLDKKGTESRKRPTHPAGEWPHQPAPARRPTMTPTPACLPTPCMEQEVTPPLPQTQPDTTRDYITYDCTQKTAVTERSPMIKKPAKPSTPDSPPKQRKIVNLSPEPTRAPSEPPVNIY